MAPSAVPVGIPGRFGSPIEIEVAEIERLIGRFAAAARTARACGFDGVQVHSAHGYLLSSFLSPLANRRTDEWGGPLENRARFTRRVVAAIRQAVGPDFPISIKMNSADFQQGGFDFEEAITLANWMVDDGLDLLEVSGGSYEQATFMGVPGGAIQQKASTRQREAYFLDFAQAMLRGVTPPLMVTGGFRSVGAMVEGLEAGIAMIGLGRPLCAEIDGPARLLAGDVDCLARFESVLAAPTATDHVRASENGELPEGFAVVAWFYQQIRRLGKGLEPNLQLSAVDAFLAERGDDSAIALATTAARQRGAVDDAASLAATRAS